MPWKIEIDGEVARVEGRGVYRRDRAYEWRLMPIRVRIARDNPELNAALEDAYRRATVDRRSLAAATNDPDRRELREILVGSRDELSDERRKI